MTAALIDMQGVADWRGLNYDTVRKGWRAWVRAGFPAPVEDARPYRWRLTSLEAWAERQEAATRAALLRPVDASDFDGAANQNEPDAPPSPPAARRIDREREAVLRLMQGARSC